MISEFSVGELDLYVAAHMRESVLLKDRLARAGVAPSMLKAVKERSERAGLNRPSLVTRSALIRFFGQPIESGAGALVYGLTLWPEHHFRFSDNGAGIFGHEGFELINSGPLPTWLSRNTAVLQQHLEIWHHTAHEVSELLGTPDLDLSWGAAGEWYYRSEEGDDIAILFDFGLLHAIASAPGTIDRHKSAV